jgi:hypothetical protein
MSEKIPVSQVLSWDFTQTKIEINPLMLAAYGLGGGIFGSTSVEAELPPLAVGDEVRVLGMNRKNRRAGQTTRGRVAQITEKGSKLTHANGLVYYVKHQGGPTCPYARGALERVPDLELLAEQAPG